MIASCPGTVSRLPSRNDKEETSSEKLKYGKEEPGSGKSKHEERPSSEKSRGGRGSWKLDSANIKKRKRQAKAGKNTYLRYLLVPGTSSTESTHDSFRPVKCSYRVTGTLQFNGTHDVLTYASLFASRSSPARK